MQYLKRVVEPQIMSKEENIYYAKLDFNALHGWFFTYLANEIPSKTKKLIDLGSGPGDTLIEISRHISQKIKLIGIDASETMTTIANKKIKEANLTNIEFIKENISNITTKYDVVISKLTLHHFENPNIFWQAVKSCSKKGTFVYIMDLHRPSKETLEQILEDAKETHKHEILIQELKQSLISAFTLEELELQIKENNLNLDIKKINKKYVVISGMI